MTIIANPLYDSVFKYLMEDEKVARMLLSALLQKDVLELQMRRHEYTQGGLLCKCARQRRKRTTYPHRVAKNMACHGNRKVPGIPRRAIPKQGEYPAKREKSQRICLAHCVHIHPRAQTRRPERTCHLYTQELPRL